LLRELFEMLKNFLRGWMDIRMESLRFLTTLQKNRWVAVGVRRGTHQRQHRRKITATHKTLTEIMGTVPKKKS
jgi:hypothetical protein